MSDIDPGGTGSQAATSIGPSASSAWACRHARGRRRIVGQVMLDRSGVAGCVGLVHVCAHDRVGTSGGILADPFRGRRAS
jgi:hypothetical protein